MINDTDYRQVDYSMILQGRCTNALTKVRVGEENLTVDPIVGETAIHTDNIELHLAKNISPFDLKTSTYQLLDIIVIMFTANGTKDQKVVFSIDDYMAIRGLKDRKEARKQLLADLTVLQKMDLTWEEKQGTNIIRYTNVHLVDNNHEIQWIDGKKTILSFRFGQAFFDVLSKYPVMPYPNQLLTLNSKKNPNSYYLLRRIAEHKNMNVGKKNENVISVKTLLDSTPCLPSYNEVMNSDRAWRRRIITPFERDMNAFADTLTWWYCYTLNKPVRLEDIQDMSYQQFVNLKIQISWKSYPDQSERLKRKHKNCQI